MASLAVPSVPAARVRRSGRRSAALLAGWSLAALAVLAPLAVFGLIPAGSVRAGGLVLLGVVALDVAVALALIPVLRAGGARTALAAAGLRLVYAAVFAVAAGSLFAGDVARFQQIWDAALLVFGVHLVAVAALVWLAPEAPRWLAVLVGIAGLGYLVDAGQVVLGTQPAVEVATVTFVGEVALLLWLLLRGGRGRRGATGAP